jgi:Kip1 ubiquitination-promoting complex protein 1
MGSSMEAHDIADYCLQRLLKEKCMSDEKLFGSFLNRLFNTLNWTITEFSVAIKEMQELSDLRQVRVCG